MRKGRMTAANCQLKRHFSGGDWLTIFPRWPASVWTSAYSTIRRERLDVENLVRRIILPVNEITGDELFEGNAF